MALVFRLGAKVRFREFFGGGVRRSVISMMAAMNDKRQHLMTIVVLTRWMRMMRVQSLTSHPPEQLSDRSSTSDVLAFADSTGFCCSRFNETLRNDGRCARYRRAALLCPIGQFIFQRVEFFGQIMKLVELRSDHFHLVTVHRPEHLNHHRHGLLKLVEHLLLHEAELIDQGHQHRFGHSDGANLRGKVASEAMTSDLETRRTAWIASGN